jgi:hypothetical protein
LRSWSAALGLRRHEQFSGNAIERRPPKNPRRRNAGEAVKLLLVKVVAKSPERGFAKGLGASHRRYDDSGSQGALSVTPLALARRLLPVSCGPRVSTDVHHLYEERQKRTHCDSRVPSTFAGGISMNPQTIEAVSVAAELTEVDSECSPKREPPVERGVWTRDIEALCRALEAQQRAHFPSIAAEEK